MAHPLATITKADMLAADDATRMLRFDLAHQIIGEACNAARDAIAVLEELPHAEWIWQTIEEIDQAVDAVRSVVPEDNLESLTLFLLSLGARLEIAAGNAWSTDSLASSAINGHRFTVDALARVAPIAQRPSSNASSPLAF